MALLYPWATKEYLLWHMSIGQCIMYHNAGIGLKYPDEDGEKGTGSLRNMSAEDQAKAIKEAREAMRRERDKEAEAEAVKDEYRKIYGDV